MRRVILEFIGGAWDGMNLCNDSLDRAETELAVRVYCATGNGEPGEEVVMPAACALRSSGSAGCVYVVENRMVVGDETLVRLACQGDAPATTNPAQPLRIVLEFDGGYLDGRTLDSHASNIQEALLALAYYHVTDQGTVGEALGGIPAPWHPAWKDAGKSARAAFRKDCEYRITDRTENAERVVIRLQYRPKAKPTDGRLLPEPPRS